jgi:hypothetical protein
MKVARDSKTGQFVQGNCGGPGRPEAGRMSKAQLKMIVAAWKAERPNGVDSLAHMLAVVSGPTCPHCGKPMALTAWKAKRTFCSSECADAADERRLLGQRRRNALSKIRRGLRPWPRELLALQRGKG